MNKRQKAILVGMILGDAYLQKTGKNNARIRLEHSRKQETYLIWKAQQFPEFFQGKPTRLMRQNLTFGKTYYYSRWQSYAAAEIGKYHKLFYQNGKKIIPENLHIQLVNPLSLAVWYMDDGYLYKRDKIAYIYLPNYSQVEVHILLEVLRLNFGLQPIAKDKTKGKVLVFSVVDTCKLLSVISDHIIPSMSYKLLDPVSTEA